MQKYQEIERSIIKTYRKSIWSKVVKAVKDYELVLDNDKIMVCISGGKDSFLLAKCLEELKKHRKINFDLKFVVMNPGYSKEVLDLIKNNALILNVPIEIFDSNIFAVLKTLDTKSPCYMCARMRRGHLYNKAKELGCNKIALGHHFDDVIETTLLSMFYGAEVKTMLPKLNSDNYPGIQLIRPLYLVKEKDIKAFCNYNNLTFINCACDFTRESEIEEIRSKRKYIKNLINNLRKDNEDIDYNIFKALDNINLNCILGYKKDNKYTSFLDINDLHKKDNS